MPIRAVERPLPRGDFGARLRDGGIEIPADLARVLDDQGIASADELLSYAESFPSAVAHGLGWSGDDVGRATRRLSDQLSPHLPPPAAAAPVSFGAMDPALLSRSDD